MKKNIPLLLLTLLAWVTIAQLPPLPPISTNNVSTNASSNIRPFNEIYMNLPDGIWRLDYSYDLIVWTNWQLVPGPAQVEIKIHESVNSFFVRATNVQNPQVSAQK